jgi:hypothetical protein
MDVKKRRTTAERNLNLKAASEEICMDSLASVGRKENYKTKQGR